MSDFYEIKPVLEAIEHVTEAVQLVTQAVDAEALRHRAEVATLRDEIETLTVAARTVVTQFFLSGEAVVDELRADSSDAIRELAKLVGVVEPEGEE